MWTGKAWNAIIFGIAGVLLIICAHPAADLLQPDITPYRGAELFAKALDEKTSRATDELHLLRLEVQAKGARNTQYRNSGRFEKLYRNEGILMFVYRNNEPVLWTHNALAPLSALEIARLGTEIHQFDNGWYRLIHINDGKDDYVAAILLYSNYRHKNQYLQTDFAKGFKISTLQGISTRSQPGAVKLRADYQYFFLLFDPPGNQYFSRPFVFIVLATLGLCLLFAAIGRGVIWVQSQAGGLAAFLLLVVVSVAARLITIEASLPSYISDFGFFNPSVYASSAHFPSLADLLINASILLFIAGMCRFILLPAARISKRAHRVPSQLILLAGLLGYALWINNLVKSLVLNSNIVFDINNVSGLSGYSLASIIAAAALYYSFVLLADAVVVYSMKNNISGRQTTLHLVLLVPVFVAITHAISIRDLMFLLWPPSIILLLISSRYTGAHHEIKLVHSTAIIAVFALVGTHNFVKYNKSREHNQQMIIAEKLAINNDPVAELLFTEVKPMLQRDPGVRKLFIENDLHTRQMLEDYIIPRFFTGYWSKYNIVVHVYQADGSAWGRLPNIMPMPFSEIRRRVAAFGESTSVDSGLYYLSDASEPATYIALVPLHYSMLANPDGYFAIEFRSKLFPQQIGFPALLMDESSRTALEASPFASAVYINGKLSRARGKIQWHSTPLPFADVGRDTYFVEREGYEHLVRKIDAGTIIVVSREIRSFLYKASTFSYLCAIFALLYILSRLGGKWLVSGRRFVINLNQRIQALLVSLTMVSMVLFAVATKYYIEQRYTDKNRAVLSEKIQSVLLEIKNKLEDEDELDYTKADYINRLLSQFSSVFFTDIHMYNPSGDLIASSQMRMFNEGLISRKINPEAYAHLHYLKKIGFVHDEQIGKLTYISAYVPFYNRNGELLAYLNLPYFARQAELNEEISSFLVSVINIFVLLFLLSILAGLFMSQWITSPLRTIRESLSEMDPGKTNRLIQYSGRDEIGLLVAEYNAKIAELETNAERLAQSERESAWREMARQVAHEIKNPLTPMKLSVQHLERYLNSGGVPDKDQIIRTASNLQEQIDALSNIATAFSNFARMPQARFEIIDVLPVINNATALFDGFGTVQIQVINKINGDAQVYADKDQLLRVFNNLLKNAMQAIPESRQGKIVLECTRHEGGVLVSVSDNGTGIAEETRAKIFVPNFTTKSRGMGLGLAMTKNIVENSKGRIWFESKPGEGSTFYVWLPGVQ